MNLLRRVLPAPLSSVALFVAWLLLARAPGAGNVALGVLLALGVPHLFPALRMQGTRVRRPGAFARYVLAVCRDVIASNLVVGWGTLRWGVRRPRHGFVVVPLDLRDPVGLAVLAMVTTIVPGTVWSELALDRSAMLLHVWDVSDEPAFVARFKARYEQPLREIFE